MMNTKKESVEMFNVFGIDHQELQEKSRVTAIALFALSTIVLEKGIVTNEEFKKYMKDATEIVDATIAEKTRQQKDVMKEEFPFLYDLFERMGTKKESV